MLRSNLFDAKMLILEKFLGESNSNMRSMGLEPRRFQPSQPWSERREEEKNAGNVEPRSYN